MAGPDDSDELESIESTESTLGKIRLKRVRASRTSLRETMTGTISDSGTTSSRLKQQLGALLIYLGSPENGFADAGHAFSIGDVSTVRFGRCSAQAQLNVDRDGFDLQLGIPLAWVSSRHAELNVVAVDSRAFTFHLTDLDSRNGTTIEGRRLTGGTTLFPGQVFEIGRAFWMIREVHARIDGQPGKLDPTGTVNPDLRQLERTLERLAASNLPVMLVGETGVGKDYLARAMHGLSGRTGPFVHANMTAGNLDTLLGGAGAAGLGQRARNGTAYIDEIAALSHEDQTKLLHLLGASASASAGELEGSEEPRVIATSTRDVRPLVEVGKFRPDLYARLAVYEARIPPLRERREDLGLLVRRLSRTREGKPAAVTTSAFRRLLGHGWPFNVRELSQTLQAALAVGDCEGTVTAAAVEEVLRYAAEVPKSAAQIQEVRDELLQQLVAHRGNTQAVAASLECDQSEVQRWLRRFELDPATYRQPLQ